MKQVINFILCLIVTSGSAQDNTFKKILFVANDLVLIDPSTDSLAFGNYSYGDRLVNYVFSLHLDGTYEKQEISCLGNYLLANGKYRFFKNKKVALTSQGKFYIYKFDKFIFLVPVSRDKKFRQDFSDKARQVYETGKLNGYEERYTDQFFIAFNLAKTYYTRLD